MKVAPEPMMSEVVRQRLELLLAEVQPRHALPEEDAGPTPVAATAPRVAGAHGSPASMRVPDAWLPAAREGPDASTAVGDSGHPFVDERPRRARHEFGGRAGEVGRKALEFTREHLAAVVVVLLVGCAWTAYSLVQARSTPVAVAAAPSVAVSPTPAPTSTPTPKVLVHVLGAVRSPGVVRLPDGSRVEDAIAAAGGLTRSADPGELNLAAVVADGSQILVGTRAKPGGEVRGASVQGGAGASSASGAKVSLNTATLEQLDTLPGVGPVTAQKILDWRAKHGRFSSVTELQEVDGIGPKTYADIAPNVRL